MKKFENCGNGELTAGEIADDHLCGVRNLG